MTPSQLLAAARLGASDFMMAAQMRWSDLSGIERVNLFIAFGLALVAFGAANRMSRQTERTIIFAFGLVGAGAIGYAFSIVLPERWQNVCDTVLLGGVLSLLIGTRRQTLWIPPRLMPILSASVGIITCALFFTGIA